MADEGNHSGHLNLTSVFAHVAVMTAVMAVAAPAALAATGATVGPTNMLFAGFNSTVDMMIVDPIKALPELFSNFEWDWSLGIEWGEAGHHGAAAAEHASHVVEGGAQAAHSSAEHAAMGAVTASGEAAVHSCSIADFDALAQSNPEALTSAINAANFAETPLSEHLASQCHAGIE